MATSSVFNLTRFTVLAVGDVIPVVNVDDLTQSANGSLDSILVSNFFASIPAPVNITSASVTSLAVGRLGATTPAFTVDSSTASQVAGFKITGAATGGTVALVVTDSGANANLTLNAKGSGTIGIGTVSTGLVTITPNVTITASLGVGSAAPGTNGYLRASRLLVDGSAYITGPGADAMSFVGTSFAINGPVSGITTLAGTGAISGFTSLALSSSLTMSGGAVLPKQVTLTYGANVALNAALGNVFYLSITNNSAFTMDAPSNPVSGQEITVILDNNSGGTTGTISTATGSGGGAWGGAFTGGTLTIGLANTSQWVYNSTIAEWCPLSAAGGNSFTK